MFSVEVARRSTTAPDSEYIAVVRYSEFDDNTTYGIYTTSAGRFKGCYIHDNGVYGVRTAGYNVFENDTIEDNLSYNIYRINSGADSVINCLIGVDNDSTQWGIYADAPAGSTSSIISIPSAVKE